MILCSNDGAAAGAGALEMPRATSALTFFGFLISDRSTADSFGRPAMIPFASSSGSARRSIVEEEDVPSASVALLVAATLLWLTDSTSTFLRRA